MTNVISIGLPKRPNLSQRQAALLKNFASHRRGPEDVYWLKENAEVLSILVAVKAQLTVQDLAVYRGFYDTLEERLRFFPQYYRFLLSICLDLEDLGMEGETGARLCADVHNKRFATGELSDLQRAEAQYLLARRGFDAGTDDLRARLLRFIDEPNTFSLPNKKAAYELTHIVFYLSEYGRRPLQLSEASLTSLEFAGLLAYLDQDVDVLAEVCVAMRFAGRAPSEIWEDWLAHEMQGFVLKPVSDGPVQDAYHEYLVTSWWAAQAGMAGFTGTPVAGGVQIERAHATRGPLRALSARLYELGPDRRAEWPKMRGLLQESIAAEHQHILAGAEQSSPRFSAFFKRFSRAK